MGKSLKQDLLLSRQYCLSGICINHTLETKQKSALYAKKLSFYSVLSNDVLPSYFVFKLSTKRQILFSSKLKEFAEDNSKFDENGRQLDRMSRKHWINNLLQAISPFPTVFLKTSNVDM